METLLDELGQTATVVIPSFSFDYFDKVGT